MIGTRFTYARRISARSSGGSSVTSVRCARRPRRSTTDPAAREYLRYVSEFTGVPVRLVSVGPDREQVVWMGRPVLEAAA